MTTNLDYWQMVKELAEKHHQEKLVEIANEHIEAYIKHENIITNQEYENQ